ncbi:putative adenylyltransferase/sulfurtransferase MoeZ [Geobacter sp. OR-1]|uniref:HesA/MoeB/ThiF family protein n=1 Tax=Geobacter sp. OR-1 TaxID=1266765 RepID=UPI000543B0C9|nr:molybdopterin-synthase adenylyltransferase MoeB [Geobacter sp. OR-1]GAM08000.1 putative adenylyltransferase/sulfurtransferase MoeZ [Geobacter sp. OR-1]
MLSRDQKERYSRHLMLEGVGSTGQERLLAGKVLVIGAGGLGSPATLYLAAAGIGTLGVADADIVELSNLQRQILHTTADIGSPKTASARRKLEAINPETKLIPYQLRVARDNIPELLNGYDFVLDCTDNFETKFLINDACVLAGKPYSHGGILRFSGQTMTVAPGRSACYRCIFPEQPDDSTALACSRAGVIGVLPGVIGTIQATEAIKHLLGIGEPLLNRMLTYDSLRMKFREIPIRRSPECPICGTLRP